MMVPPLDIFRVASDGQLIWIAPAENVESAQRRIKILMSVHPGDYVIYNQETGHKTLVRAENPAEPSSSRGIDSSIL
jgi:hypothetical protein